MPDRQQRRHLVYLRDTGSVLGGCWIRGNAEAGLPNL